MGHVRYALELGWEEVLRLAVARCAGIAQPSSSTTWPFGRFLDAGAPRRCLAVIVIRVAAERNSHPLERSKNYCYVDAREVIAPGDNAMPEERSKLVAEQQFVAPGDGASEASEWNRSTIAEQP